MEIKFGVRFVYGQKIKEKEKGFWGILGMAREIIPWELIAIVDSKREILLLGTVKDEERFRNFNINSNFKSVCFQYIQKLGMEGWELVGEMPTTFVRSSDAFNVSLSYYLNTDNYPKTEFWSGYSQVVNGEGYPMVRFSCDAEEYIINIFGASFFFKRQK